MGDEFGHIVADRIGDDLARGADLHDAATLHQGDAVTQFEGLIQIVADEDDGAFQLGLQAKKLILQAGADQRVKGRKRLIHQEDRRIGGEGAGQADALLHAAGQLTDLAFGPLRQVHQRQLFIDLGAALGRGLAGKFQAQPDIVAHRAPRQQAELLEHHGDSRQAQTAQCVRRGLGHRDHFKAVRHPHFTAHHRVQGVDAAQQGGFARAGKPHQNKDFALGHGQAAIVDAKNLAGPGLNVRAGKALIHQGQGAVGLVAKDDGDAVEFNGGQAHFVTLSIRSSAMASATITEPASNP